MSFDGLTGEVEARRRWRRSRARSCRWWPAQLKAAQGLGHLPALQAAADLGRQVPAGWASAPTPTMPDQAELAYAFGARGIGLCRTEHMFFGEGRIPIVQRDDPGRQRSRSPGGARRAAAAAARRLLRRVQGDARHAGHDPTIDPPLHEFLPKREELMVEIARLEDSGKAVELAEKQAAAARASSSCTSSTRCSATAACRLGITYPEITEMQTRAIIEAARQLQQGRPEGRARDHDPARRPREGAARSEGVVDRVAARGDEGAGRQDQVPGRHDDRGAARRADRRRDRAGGAVLLVRHQRPDAVDASASRATTSASSCASTRTRRSSTRIRSRRIDAVGRRRSWCEMAVEKGRKTRPDLKLGICGEHGGDPSSIHFFEKVGSRLRQRSPYRVPVARLAAAQAALSRQGRRLGTAGRHAIVRRLLPTTR